MNNDMKPYRKLEKSSDHKMLFGVLGGLADFLGWSPTTVRLLFLLSMLLPGPQILAYIIAIFIMPKESRY